jgi:hypothetical protein
MTMIVLPDTVSLNTVSDTSGFFRSCRGGSHYQLERQSSDVSDAPSGSAGHLSAVVSLGRGDDDDSTLPSPEMYRGDRHHQPQTLLCLCWFSIQSDTSHTYLSNYLYLIAGHIGGTGPQAWDTGKTGWSNLAAWESMLTEVALTRTVRTLIRFQYVLFPSYRWLVDHRQAQRLGSSCFDVASFALFCSCIE